MDFVNSIRKVDHFYPIASPADFSLFILYSLSMCVPHPGTVNPFKSALLVAYLREKEKAVSIANEGGVSPDEPLVWVLWKILRGDGNDVST